MINLVKEIRFISGGVGTPSEILRCQSPRSIQSHAKLENTTTAPFNLAACLKIVIENSEVKFRMRPHLEKQKELLVFAFDASII